MDILFGSVSVIAGVILVILRSVRLGLAGAYFGFGIRVLMHMSDKFNRIFRGSKFSFAASCVCCSKLMILIVKPCLPRCHLQITVC